MKDYFQLADLLEQYVERAGYTPGQLAHMSGIPKATIVNWIKGRVQKPRARNDLIKLATLLHLDEAEASALLQVVGYPSIAKLLAQNANIGEEDLLAPWREAKRQTPFQAIHRLPYFVGREEELNVLKRLLLNDNPVTIYSLHGMGGVGKTALAAQAAYDLSSHFPDGVLWARLDTSDTMSILSTFAAAFGHDLSRYPDLDSRSRMLRTFLSDKRVLIVLDNASCSNEIIPLLPPTDSCAVIVTTRHRNLLATHGANNIHLGAFSPEKEESLKLFAGMLGQERIDQEKREFREIADVLGHLPLAIAVVAGRLVCEPGWSTSEFLDRLNQEERRLNALTCENQSVRMSFNLSFDALSPDQQCFFSTLGVFGYGDFSVDAVAYITGLPLDETHDNLRQLYKLSLIQQEIHKRYKLHPLLSDYACEKLTNLAIYERSVAYFVQYAEMHKKDYDAIDLEIDNIFAMLEVSLKENLSDYLVRGVNAIYHFLEIKGLYQTAKVWLNHAQQRADVVGDVEGLAVCLKNLGRTARHQGDYPQAETHLHHGLSLARKIADCELIGEMQIELGILLSIGEQYEQAERYLKEAFNLAHQIESQEQIAAIHTSLGKLKFTNGKYRDAENELNQGLNVARESGQEERVSALLNELGVVIAMQGNHDRAQPYFLEALNIARRNGHCKRVSTLLLWLGYLALMHQNLVEAEKYFREALSLIHQIDDPRRNSVLLMNFGVLASKRKAYNQAETYFQEALDLAREFENDWLISVILNRWAYLYLYQNMPKAAHKLFSCSLSIAQKIDALDLIGSSSYGLARVAAALGKIEEARLRGEEALSAYTTLDHYRATDVARWLKDLSLRGPSHHIVQGGRK